MEKWRWHFVHQGHTHHPALSILNGPVWSFYSFPDIKMLKCITALPPSCHSRWVLMESWKEKLCTSGREAIGAQGGWAPRLTWAELGAGDKNWEGFAGLTPWQVSNITVVPLPLLWPHTIFIARTLTLTISSFLHWSSTFTIKKYFFVFLMITFLILRNWIVCVLIGGIRKSISLPNFVFVLWMKSW